ncbi:hypothetical protein H4R18_004948 [Coemansia javaensis]|uniref:Transforming acidic coiled-coil-containing protein C-terminal domain-containing protein n=1 Tax=Coemansia javaensis TaxID=2761396 RepID=A0A9W8H449_9FUNG|nr:hypothetical protein H4R18_004948 [Coemansia javaensis]
MVVSRRRNLIVLFVVLLLSPVLSPSTSVARSVSATAARCCLCILVLRLGGTLRRQLHALAAPMDSHSNSPARTPAAGRSDPDLALESPPASMLVQSPFVGQNYSFGPVPIKKRTRAEMATPRRPGTDEARAQLAAEYIDSPARAPSAMKRLMRAESPGARSPQTEDDCCLLSGPPEVPPLLGPINGAAAVDPPPRFSLSPRGPADMAIDRPLDSDDHVFGSPPPTRSQKSVSPMTMAQKGVGSLEITESAAVTAGSGLAITEDPSSKAVEAHGSKVAESTGDAMAVDDAAMAVDDAAMAVDDVAMAIDSEALGTAAVAETAAPLEIVVERAAPEAVVAAALGARGPAGSAAGPRLAAVVRLPHVSRADAIRAELTTARIFDDPDLLSAAAVPLPRTPSNDSRAVTPLRKAGGSPDFSIPADWLMDLGTGSGLRPERRQRPGGVAESPLKRFSSPRGDGNGNGDGDGDSLIPVTPANQKLLDSLEIQWVSPRQVPKFSEADVAAIHAEYEERIQRQTELREKLLVALKDEYAENMRKQEERAEQLLKEAEDLFQTHIEQREREFAARLEAEQLRRQQDLDARDEAHRAELARAAAERAAAVAERDELSAMLDDYVATSAKLLEEREAEGAGLTRELGKLTLERQRLQEQLDEATAQIGALGTERVEALARAEAAASEAARLEQLAAALRNDVLVAEERSTKIKSHAEATLARANDEIASVHQQLAASRDETAALKSQSVKADAKARSLQIQLDSMKRQNEELLALCEGLGV